MKDVIGIDEGGFYTDDGYVDPEDLTTDQLIEEEQNAIDILDGLCKLTKNEEARQTIGRLMEIIRELTLREEQ